MKVKNTSGKIINFGPLTLLPGETDTLPKEFENNPVVDAFVETDTIVLIKNAPVVDESDKAGVPENLSDMKKDELLALCSKLGIEADEAETKAVIIEKIKEATAE